MPRKRYKTPKVSTVIGPGTVIEGNLLFDGGLHLDGRVVGNVNGTEQTDATLTVSERGVIEGDVRVECLFLNGSVTGDVYAAQRVELAEEARVNGTVHYRLLEMAMGAEVNGKLVHCDEIELSGDESPEAQEEMPLDAAEASSPTLSKEEPKVAVTRAVSDEVQGSGRH